MWHMLCQLRDSKIYFLQITKGFIFMVRVEKIINKQVSFTI